MIIVEHTTDFEFFSSTSQGAIQGYGYEFHKCELFYLTNFLESVVTNFVSSRYLWVCRLMAA